MEQEQSQAWEPETAQDWEQAFEDPDNAESGLEAEPEEEEASDEEEEDDGLLEEEEDEEDAFEIDEELKEKLDEKSLKRLKDHLKGAQKVKKQAEELKSRYSDIEALVKALENKDTAEQALRMITQAVEQAHGISLAEADDDDLDEEWLHVAKKKVVEPAVKTLAQQYEARIAELEKAVKAHQAEKEKEYAKLAISKVKGYVKSRYPGLTVTLDQVAEAVRRYPELAGKPITAWLKTNGDLIAKYEGKPVKKVHKMARSGDGGSVLKDIKDLRFEDYIAGEG